MQELRGGHVLVVETLLRAADIVVNAKDRVRARGMRAAEAAARCGGVVRACVVCGRA